MLSMLAKDTAYTAIYVEAKTDEGSGSDLHRCFAVGESGVTYFYSRC